MFDYREFMNVMSSRGVRRPIRRSVKTTGDTAIT